MATESGLHRVHEAQPPQFAATGSGDWTAEFAREGEAMRDSAKAVEGLLGKPGHQPTEGLKLAIQRLLIQASSYREREARVIAPLYVSHLGEEGREWADASRSLVDCCNEAAAFLAATDPAPDFSTYKERALSFIADLQRDMAHEARMFTKLRAVLPREENERIMGHIQRLKHELDVEAEKRVTAAMGGGMEGEAAQGTGMADATRV